MPATPRAPLGRTVVVSDVSESEQLIRYAFNAQVELIMDKSQVTQDNLAVAANMRPDFLSKLLNGREKMSLRSLRAVDTATVALAPSNVPHVGGLSHLALRLRGLLLPDQAKNEIGMFADLPPSWTPDLLISAPNNEFDVLTQAAALLANYEALQGQRAETMLRVQERYREKLLQIVDELFVIGVAPPTARNVEALVMLGRLAIFDLDPVWERLEDLLRTHPLGFRVWRAITKLVLMVKGEARVKAIEPAIRNRVRDLFDRADELRTANIYPARSLDLELAIVVPPSWSPVGDDWVGDFLTGRAADPKASVRERGTAAFGILERQRRHDEYKGSDAGYDEILNDLTKTFRQPLEPGGSETIHEGLAWVAKTLEEARKHDDQVAWNEVSSALAEPAPQAKSSETPDDLKDDWLAVIRYAAKRLARQPLPVSIRDATVTLFVHALLQNAGVHRRQALDTLVAGGWTREVSESFIYVLVNEHTKPWLRIRALFALGFLQQRDRRVVIALADRCILSCKVFIELYNNGTYKVETTAETHAALFAVGDCFGAFGAEIQAKNVFDRLAPTLEEVVYTLVPRSTSNQTDSPDQGQMKATGGPDGRLSPTDMQDHVYPVARALAYMLTVTGQRLTPRGPSLEHANADQSPHLAAADRTVKASSLLDLLKTYDDVQTRRLAQWGLDKASTMLPTAHPQPRSI